MGFRKKTRGAISSLPYQDLDTLILTTDMEGYVQLIPNQNHPAVKNEIGNLNFFGQMALVRAAYQLLAGDQNPDDSYITNDLSRRYAFNLVKSLNNAGKNFSNFNRLRQKDPETAGRVLETATINAFRVALWDHPFLNVSYPSFFQDVRFKIDMFIGAVGFDICSQLGPTIENKLLAIHRAGLPSTVLAVPIFGKSANKRRYYGENEDYLNSLLTKTPIPYEDTLRFVQNVAAYNLPGDAVDFVRRDVGRRHEIDTRMSPDATQFLQAVLEI